MRFGCWWESLHEDWSVRRSQLTSVRRQRLVIQLPKAQEVPALAPMHLGRTNVHE